MSENVSTARSSADTASAALRVNRSLNDRAMDAIDHALGRPLNPMIESFRNHYVTDSDCTLAMEMRASLNWKEQRTRDGMTCFAVSDEGRRASADHLKDINDPHRAFIITFDGCEGVEVSTSPAKARYAYWLEVSDSRTRLTFGEFLKRSSVRLADGHTRSAKGIGA